MNEQSLLYKNRRKPYLAGLLSLLMPGLGHLYSGRFIRCLTITFIFTIVIPTLFTLLAYYSASIQDHYVLMLAPISVLALLVWLTAIVDSVLIAKKTDHDYELKEYNRWYVYLIFYLIISLGVSRVQSIALTKSVEPMSLPTTSMLPTLHPGDSFFVNKVVYTKTQPCAGDIIIFPDPQNPENIYCRRIIALEGDTVRIENGYLYVNEKKLERELLNQTILADEIGDSDGQFFIEKNGNVQYRIFIEQISLESGLSDYPEKKVPQGCCFVLGDNRLMSSDSREFGPVQISSIIGKADYIFWPAKDFSHFGKLNNSN